MGRIVALDTALEWGSLALVEDGEVVEEMALEGPEGYGAVLFPALARLMQRHGWRHENVTGYAAGAGPGSFMGVRVALAAVKGLAEAVGAKAAAISNLQAMAWYGRGPLRAPFLDARRNEVFCALYDGELRLQGEERAARFEAWRESLPAGVELLTPQPALYAVGAVATPRELAGVIGRLAAERLVDPLQLDANYVRRSDASLNWVDRQ